MTAPPQLDDAERARFKVEHGRNISVIASAGVGKTRAIVERIVHLALLPEEEAIRRLTRLVVVTYSVAAAQEMQQRARTAIRAEKQVSPKVLRAFQQTFFGTIHSYCVRLLERFGHHLGLPSSLGLVQPDDDLWNRFLLHGLPLDPTTDASFSELFHFFPVEKLYQLGAQVSPGEVADPAPLPDPDVQRLLTFDLSGFKGPTKNAVVRAQERLRLWQQAWARGDRFHPLPQPPTGQPNAFTDLWGPTFAPLKEWIRETALAFGRHIANAYETYRLAQGVMTYDDQVRLALRVLQEAPVQRELAAEGFSVLLDEAQDTDRRQFEVLLLVAGLGAGSPTQPDTQTICIVGDFQQAIWAPRSDLGFYREIHDRIVSNERGMLTDFEVTFRCDRQIIAFVNQVFAPLLDGADGQAEFHALQPRANAGRGQVVRWTCPALPVNSGEKITAAIRSRHEARWLAAEIAAKGFTGLGAARWQDIAILCPRRDWLTEIYHELRHVQVPAQLHVSSDSLDQSTARAWLTSLVWIAAHPDDRFEIAGVLREIFGVSDDAMARFTEGHGERLRLDRDAGSTGGEVHDTLALLRRITAPLSQRPLHQAVLELVQGAALRERLLALPYEPDERVEQELDALLATIFDRAAQRLTLAELAQEMRASLGQASPIEDEIRDAVQLLTSHRAKGLEWPTVIVPFISRPIGVKSAAYPRLEVVEHGREILYRDSTDFAAFGKTASERRERQQLKRLLYVVCTRAEHTLLLIDDEALYAGEKRQGLGPTAEALHFNPGQTHRELWQHLPGALEPDFAATPAALTPIPPALKLPKLSAAVVKRAVKYGTDFPQRITPHTLAVHPPADAEPETWAEREEDQPTANPDHFGTRYGTWWHELVEVVPWSQPVAAWEEKFAAALVRSPQPERSVREWNLFRSSELAAWLAHPQRLIQVETPFLWPQTRQRCLEGVIDLAVLDRSTGEWRVIDWKTNRLPADGATGLVDIYREQIFAYVTALRQMLDAPVSGSLYLTVTGEWRPVD